MNYNLKRHQETQICKNKALLTTLTDEDKNKKKDKHNEYYKRYYETNKEEAISKQSEKTM